MYNVYVVLLKVICLKKYRVEPPRAMLPLPNLPFDFLIASSVLFVPRSLINIIIQIQLTSKEFCLCQSAMGWETILVPTTSVFFLVNSNEHIGIFTSSVHAQSMSAPAA